MISEVDQLGRTEHDVYDEFGRATRATLKDGTVINVSPIETQGLIATDQSSDPGSPAAIAELGPATTSYADANGNVVQTRLDRAGQAASSADGLGSLPRVVRNQENLVTESINARGNETAFTYDTRGNVLSVTDEVDRDTGAGGLLLPGEKSAVGIQPQALATADFNGDGVSDLATANSFSGDVSVLLGKGDGSFAGHAELAVGAETFSLTAADFNGDGISDLAVANLLSFDVSVLLAKGDGSFAAQTTFAVGANPSSVTVADFNGDGNSDLATANLVSGDVSVLLGKGDGSFTAQTTSVVMGGPSSVAVADFNADGVSDLATSNASSNDVSRRRILTIPDRCSLL